MSKPICICDEINSRHCQYHQELADLMAERNEFLDNESKMNGALSAKQEIIDTLKADKDELIKRLGRALKEVDYNWQNYELRTDERDEANSRIQRLESALKFYAEDCNTSFCDCSNCDEGNTARKALDGE
jgi:chromosome segregation ATPase